MGELKELRNEKKLTQQQVADLVGVSLRSYISYENDESKIGTINLDGLTIGKWRYLKEKEVQKLIK